MIVEIHVWRLAKYMIEWHGAEAESEACTAALARVKTGDVIGAEEWLRTLRAIRKLQQGRDLTS